VENMRLELLHEEFMMLTPFRACKTTSRLDGNSKCEKLSDLCIALIQKNRK